MKNPAVIYIDLSHFKKIKLTKNILNDLELLDIYYDEQLNIDGKYILMENLDKWKGFITCKDLFEQNIIDEDSPLCN